MCEVLALGENHEGVGVDPVLLHCFGRRLGLHELLKRRKVGISTIIPTRFEPWGSWNVRAVIPRGPNTRCQIREELTGGALEETGVLGGEPAGVGTGVCLPPLISRHAYGIAPGSCSAELLLSDSRQR
jgi:hypothetical protein